MPICFGSEALDSEKTSGKWIIQIGNTVTPKRYWCTSVVTSGKVTPHASAGWYPFQSYTAMDVGMHRPGRILAINM